MISSLADAEARVVMTTRRVRFSAFGLAWNSSLLFSSRCRSLCTYSASTCAGRALAADQAGEVLGHADQPAAVVAQVEDELGRAGVAEGGERLVERRHRRLDEVAEHDVADLAAVDLVELGQLTRAGW